MLSRNSCAASALAGLHEAHSSALVYEHMKTPSNRTHLLGLGSCSKLWMLVKMAATS